jgi:hypothetical protein
MFVVKLFDDVAEKVMGRYVKSETKPRELLNQPPHPPMPLRLKPHPRLFRTYATAAPGPLPAFQVFNRNTKLLQRERAARNAELSRTTDYLRDHVATDLTERLLVRAPPSSSPPSRTNSPRVNQSEIPTGP